MVKSLNKSRNIIIFSICLAVLTFILLQSCNPIVESLGPFSSPSIKISKSRGVFLWEYVPVSVMIYDSIGFEIKEVFAEKQYGYYGYNDLRYKIAKDKTQIKIVARKNLSLLKYFELWVVEDFDWSAHPFGLVRSYNNIYPPDTLIVKILKVDINKNGGAGQDDKRIIGSFTLYHKQ